MKYIKLIMLSTGILCAHFQLSAQNYEDFAFLFSQTSKGGSARVLGIGGANTALGGDISSAFANPAGLGFINKSEFTISPQLNFLNSSSMYIGNTTDDFKTNFNIAQGGIAYRTPGNDKGKFRGGAFAISVNRVANFQNNVLYQGENYLEDDGNGNLVAREGTYADFADYATFNFNDNVDNLAKLAFNTFLIDEFFITDINGDTTDSFIDRNFYAVDEFGDYILENGELIPALPTVDFPALQRESIETEGAQYQTNISYGANFDDKIYLGASFGFTSINYRSTRVYTETQVFANEEILLPATDLLNVRIIDSREITGAGFNATFGMIVRPIDLLSLGVSYTTPTWNTLDDVGTLTVQTNFDTQTFNSSFDNAPFRFDLQTPAKLSAGAVVFLGKSGFLTGDVDFVDYSGNRLSARGDDFTNENEFIRSEFDNVINYRFGGEFRYEFLRFRAGYSHLGDPTEGIDDLDRSINSFSVGLGLRVNDFFGDLAVVSSNSEASISPYPGAPLAAQDNESTAVTLTFGFKF